MRRFGLGPRLGLGLSPGARRGRTALLCEQCSRRSIRTPRERVLQHSDARVVAGALCGLQRGQRAVRSPARNDGARDGWGAPPARPERYVTRMVAAPFESAPELGDIDAMAISRRQV